MVSTLGPTIPFFSHLTQRCRVERHGRVQGMVPQRPRSLATRDRVEGNHGNVGLRSGKDDRI